MKNSIVKKRLENPNTGKTCKEVYVNNRGIFMWNTVYKVYNSIDNYDQLTLELTKDIVWEKSF